ncbi:hypothetical protein VB264_21840 [Arcicella aquatica]|uniref:Uncharacterized protein n=1 Tax=Arcicella aquatica TaxID=217141 RepID=A0ABU5QUR1_9BACT|nr:hypothetical protein [Arcicella aquatica]MEA5260454.1 hypothetical protein [Arcicella aquatica]
MLAFNFRLHKLYTHSQQTELKSVQQVQKTNILAYLLYAISGVITAIWAIEFFTLHCGQGIHLLLIIVANLILLSITQCQEKAKSKIPLKKYYFKKSPKI